MTKEIIYTEEQRLESLSLALEITESILHYENLINNMCKLEKDLERFEIRFSHKIELYKSCILRLQSRRVKLMKGF
jgi:hypothetical protein